MASSDGKKREARVLATTWVVLVALTLGSFWLADSSTSVAVANAWVLGFAALKSHAIAGVFMEMRRGPLAAAVAMSGFLLAEAALIVMILL